ncbi:NAD(P)H-binding protein [Spirillospora sp. CA-294931]|uniref:NAD(P)H-binding protein n=1 Tax=Spirillospora sp. CA-294931 TaxID=3240042 RepID=UPI003D938EE4
MSGISGLGGHLAPHLLARGHEVVGLSRDPRRVAADVPCVRADAATGEGLDAAMRGIDVAYFLINTYERRNTEGFEARDRRVALNFATAARNAGVGRVVYLGVPPASDPARTSPHIRSRLEVEDILLTHVPGSVSIGTFTIVSPRSRSFRVIMRMLRTSPVIPLPPWRGHRTQPADIRDVFAALANAAELPALAGRRLRVGGPETVTWDDLLRRVASRLPGRRAFVPLPRQPPSLVLRLLTTVNGGDPALLLPLLESVNAGDVVLPANDFTTLGVTPRPLTQTIDDAVTEYLDGTWK